MNFLRYIIGLTIAFLITALGAVAMPMAPSSSHQAEFCPHQPASANEFADVHFAARAPPLAVANVAFTGAAVAGHGNGFVMHGPEIHVASFGFGVVPIATNTGPRAPRVDVSDDLVPTRNPNVDAQYRYGDPDSGHGIEVTVDNGALSLDVAARGDASTLGSGTDMFNSAMLRLQRDGVEIDRIQGIWIPGTGSDNFAQFNSNIAAGMTRSEAAQNTWTGRIAASHGFTEVIETTRPGSNVVDFDFVRP